jgi:CheY-like chemotaxis protein
MAGLRAAPVTKRALVVDDEKPLLQLQVSFLSDIGYSAAGVSTGEEAVRYLEGNKVDLVISDVRMPGAIDGLKLYEWVGEHRPELVDRFIFVSGDAVAIQEGEFSRQRDVPCLQKPFRFGEYSQFVQRVVEG